VLNTNQASAGTITFLLDETAATLPSGVASLGGFQFFLKGSPADTAIRLTRPFAALLTGAAIPIFTEDGSVHIVTPSQPRIIADPVDSAINSNQAAQFSVTAAGVPPLHYQWLVAGHEIAGATNTNFTLAALPAGFDAPVPVTVLVTNEFGVV